MARYIDADALIYSSTILYTNDGAVTGSDAIITKTEIDQAPTADVVEVVRCKDCVCSEDDVVDEDMIWCKNYECCIHKNGYCFYGERKE